MGRADARLGSMSSTGDEALVSTVVQQVTPANSPRRTEQDLTPPPILRRVRSTFGAVGGGVTTAAARDVSTSVGGDDAALSTATSEIGAVGCLQRAWRRARASLIERVNSGALAVLLVANLGIAGKDLPRGKPNAEVRQRHIHTTVHHAAQRAAFLMVNEYGWGSDAGPEGTRPAVQQCTGLTLTTRSPGAEPPPLRCNQGAAAGATRRRSRFSTLATSQARLALRAARVGTSSPRATREPLPSSACLLSFGAQNSCHLRRLTAAVAAPLLACHMAWAKGNARHHEGDSVNGVAADMHSPTSLV